MAVVVKSHLNRHHAILWFNYLPYLFMAPAIIGLIISVLNSRTRDSMGIPGGPHVIVDEVIESHYQWLIRSFVIGVLLSMTAFGTLFMGFGFLISLVAVGFWFERIFRGMYALAMNQPMPGTK